MKDHVFTALSLQFLLLEVALEDRVENDVSEFSSMSRLLNWMLSSSDNSDWVTEMLSASMAIGFNKEEAIIVRWLVG